MSEARLLSYVVRYPHPTALARRLGNGDAFTGLRRLEARGLLTRRHGHYRLTRRGFAELDAARAIARLLARSPAQERTGLASR